MKRNSANKIASFRNTSKFKSNRVYSITYQNFIQNPGILILMLLIFQLFGLEHLGLTHNKFPDIIFYVSNFYSNPLISSIRNLNPDLS